MNVRIICMLLTLASAGPLSAQQDSVPPPPAEGGFAQPFWGGVIGSTIGGLAGFAIGDRSHDCEQQPDPADFCGLGDILLGTAVGSAVGAAVGSYIGGRLTGGDPSALAAGVGSLLGMGAGTLTSLGIGYLFGHTEAAGPIAAVTFVVTHGGIAALFTSRSMQSPAEWQ